MSHSILKKLMGSRWYLQTTLLVVVVVDAMTVTCGRRRRRDSGRVIFFFAVTIEPLSVVNVFRRKFRRRRRRRFIILNANAIAELFLVIFDVEGKRIVVVIEAATAVMTAPVYAVDAVDAVAFNGKRQR